MERNNKKNAAAVLMAGAALAVYLFYDFVATTQILNAETAPPNRTDAIVVLTGGKGRAEEGLRRLRKGASRTLILSGVNEGAGLDSIYRRKDKIGERERQSIILEKNSRSTYENAVEVNKIVRRQKLKSILLITSVYHMKRAHYTFRKVIPKEVEIIPLAVSSPNYDEEKWWGAKSLGLLAPEFVKYYFYKLRLSLPAVS